MPSLTTTKLKTLCRVHDISHYSGKRKSELIVMVQSNFTEHIDNAVAKSLTIVSSQRN